MTAALELPADLKVTAFKEKDREPYTVTLGERHRKVLAYLASQERTGLGVTDAQLTFGIGLHMAAARRCELRDLGAIRRGGRYRNSWTWKLTDKGREVLAQLNSTISNKEQQ